MNVMTIFALTFILFASTAYGANENPTLFEKINENQKLEMEKKEERKQRKQQLKQQLKQQRKQQQALEKQLMVENKRSERLEKLKESYLNQELKEEYRPVLKALKPFFKEAFTTKKKCLGGELLISSLASYIQELQYIHSTMPLHSHKKEEALKDLHKKILSDFKQFKDSKAKLAFNHHILLLKKIIPKKIYRGRKISTVMLEGGAGVFVGLGVGLHVGVSTNFYGEKYLISAIGGRVGFVLGGSVNWGYRKSVLRRPREIISIDYIGGVFCAYGISQLSTSTNIGEMTPYQDELCRFVRADGEGQGLGLGVGAFPGLNVNLTTLPLGTDYSLFASHLGLTAETIPNESLLRN